MTTKAGHFEAHHDGVTIRVACGGRGQLLVLRPGLLTTQADLRELIELLRRDYDVATRASASATASGTMTTSGSRCSKTRTVVECHRRRVTTDILCHHDQPAVALPSPG